MLYEMLVVALSGFDRYGAPTEYTRRRISVAHRMVKDYGIPYLVLSGGKRGAADFNKDIDDERQKVTEADLAYRYILSNFRIPHWVTILLDRKSNETIGNVIIPVEAFARPLSLTRILCVTSTFHAPRVQRFYSALCPSFSAAVIPVDYEEYNLDAAARGTHFVDKICTDNPDPEKAFEMLKAEQQRNFPLPADRDYDEFRDLHRIVEATRQDKQSNYDELTPIVETINSPQVDSWRKRWRTAERSEARIDVYDAFTKWVYFKDDPQKRAKAELWNNKLLHLRGAVSEAIELLDEIGTVIPATLTPEAAQIVLHEVPARFWFITRNFHGFRRATHDKPGFRRAVAVSLYWLTQRHQPLTIYFDYPARGERVKDYIVPLAEIKNASREVPKPAVGRAARALTKDQLLLVIENAPLVAVDVIVVDPHDKVLLGKRRNAPAKNSWFVPGGRIYKGESVADAFRRICRDELGIENAELEHGTFLGYFTHHYEDENFLNVEGVDTDYIVLAIEYSLEELPEGLSAAMYGQHELCDWVTRDELLARDDVHENTKRFFRGTRPNSA